MRETLAVVALLAVLAGGGWLLMRSAGAAEQPASAPVIGTQDGDAEPVALKGEPPKIQPIRAVRNPRSAEGMMAYPDGTFLPMLNGVTGTPITIAWPPERDYSPVIRKEYDADREFWVYRHADGSTSYTLSKWRDDLGRMDGIGMLENPTDPVKRVD